MANGYGDGYSDWVAYQRQAKMNMVAQEQERALAERMLYDNAIKMITKCEDGPDKGDEKSADRHTQLILLTEVE